MVKTKEKILLVIDMFKELETNWDSYGAPPVSNEAIKAAKKFINECVEGKLPFVGPTCDGGIEFEWDELIISIKSDGSIDSDIYVNLK